MEVSNELALALKPLKRQFIYNGMKLTDPGVGMTPDQVRDFHAATNYPELNNSVIDVETKNGVMVIQFRKAVGTKGACLDGVVNGGIQMRNWISAATST